MPQVVTSQAVPVSSTANALPSTSAAADVFRHAFEPAAGVTAAEALTRQLTHSHYENFSVVSFLLPKHLRQDFCNVYAFCRTGDDLADEVPDRSEALRSLGLFREGLHACYAGRPGSAVYMALAETIRRHEIPITPFDDLLDAFEQDQRIDRYQTVAQLLDYSRRSADPVGRLVLWICGYRDPQRQRLSDKTSTALQLANFWQDIRRDLLERNRIYLPAESMERFGLNEAQLRDQIVAGSSKDALPDQFQRLIRSEVDRAAVLFDEGDELLPLLDRSVRGQIALFGSGGQAVLEAIRRQNYDTLSRRPALSKWQKGHLIFTALTGRLAGGWGSAPVGPSPAAEARP